MDIVAPLETIEPDPTYLETRGKRKGAYWSRTYHNQRLEWPKTKMIFQLLDLQPGTKILDVGAGGGFFTFHFSDLVGDAGVVYANEIDEKLYRVLLAETALANKNNITPLLVHEFQLGVPEKSVDIIFSNNVYRWNDCCEIVNKQLVSAHARALKQGGRVLLVNDFIHNREWNTGQGKTGETVVRGSDLGAEVLISLFEQEFRLLHYEATERVNPSDNRRQDTPAQLPEGYFLLFEKR